ncbi:MAG: alpha-glucosidase/alpha-galactosidase [Methylacidiphilales bacterium]|nr:alpha-glucosidase/alpha-galactosidase [Candidatus Methylacidiphilales bacterium]
MATKPSKKFSAGNAAHTKPADTVTLSGEFPRPIKITMMGAGSGFTPTLMRDVIRIPGNKGGTIALVDIDRERLRTMHKVIEKIIAAMGADNWKVVSTDKRREVLKGTDYVVNCIEVSGLDCVRFDNDIPARYGINQCIGDTIGPGGLFKALRTIPVWLGVLKDVEDLCPNALVLNYTNPMNMLCLAAARTTSLQFVGLCHSVQGTGHLLADRAGVPYTEMEWECAGINHLAWFTKLKHNGRDLYPLLMKKAQQDLAGKPSNPKDAKDLVRKDMMLHFGAFITESSGHLSEYLPYYRKRKDLIKRYSRDGYDGGTSFYADNWPTWRKNGDQYRMDLLSGAKSVDWNRSWEYASWIIEAREKNSPFRIHGNVMNSRSGNDTLISNLPATGCVEVACMIDSNGINPTRYGALPPQMAALCASNMAVFELGATAAIERSKDAAIHALMLDPLSAATCSPAEIKEMTLELFEAEKAFLPKYR